MNTKNKNSSFIVLDENTYPIIEKLDELIEELKIVELEEEILENIREHIEKVLL